MRAWKDARAGDPRVVLVGGEPGVGKTRLAAELARIVSSNGADVLYGRCEEDIGIPYQPWVEALRYLLAHEPRDLLGELGRGARRRARPGSCPTSRRDSVSNQTCHRATKTRTSPTCSVLSSDFSLACAEGARSSSCSRTCTGPPSSRCCCCATSIASTDPRRLLIVGTYRPTDLDVDHPLTDVLAAMHREPHVQRVDVHGLSETEVVDLLEAMAGHALDDAGIAFARAVHRETDGNPFFTNEIVRHLTESGVISQSDDGRWIAAPDFSLTRRTADQRA